MDGKLVAERARTIQVTVLPAGVVLVDERDRAGRVLLNRLVPHEVTGRPHKQHNHGEEMVLPAGGGQRSGCTTHEVGWGYVAIEVDTGVGSALPAQWLDGVAGDTTSTCSPRMLILWAASGSRGELPHNQFCHFSPAAILCSSARADACWSGLSWSHAKAAAS